MVHVRRRFGNSCICTISILAMLFCKRTFTPIFRPLDARRSAERRSVKRKAAAGWSAERQNPTETLVCATEVGRELEALLRTRLAGVHGEDTAAVYKTVSKRVVVGSSKELGEPPFVGELGEGTLLEVEEVVHVEGQGRVRGRIRDPAGWISLLNVDTGYRWAAFVNGFADFDAQFDDVLGRLGEQEDVDDALLSDLWYVAAVRKYVRNDLPVLPSFEGPAAKTWALSGSGDALSRWRAMAEDHAHDVHVVPLNESLRANMRRAILGQKEEFSVLLDVYLARSGVQGSVGAEKGDGLFEEFLERFKNVKQEMLVKVGGAGGISGKDPAFQQDVRPAEGAGQESSIRSEAQAQEWFQLFAAISTNTRISQADAYLGHALFGLCFRRLTRRFEFERRLGTLPPISEAAQTRARLEQTAAQSDGVQDGCEETISNVGFIAAEFESFVQDAASRSDGVAILDQVLDLTNETLAAIRKQIDFTFGAGLAEEIAKPMNRAKAEIQREGTSYAPLETTTALLMESANSGEVRMLSTSLDVQERLTWDAVAFGTFLQDADDAVSLAAR